MGGLLQKGKLILTTTIVIVLMADIFRCRPSFVRVRSLEFELRHTSSADYPLDSAQLFFSYLSSPEFEINNKSGWYETEAYMLGATAPEYICYAH